MDINSPFFLSPDCKVVKGHLRSAIYDLTRGEIKFIPNALAEILAAFNKKTIADVFLEFDSEDHPMLQSYFDFLYDQEYIIICDEDELDFFPPVSNTWNYPAKISNAILVFDNSGAYDVVKTIQQLELLGCKHIELKSDQPVGLSDLEIILESLKQSTIKSIDLLLHFDPTYNMECLLKLLKRYPRIISTLIFSAPFTLAEKNIPIKFVKSSIDQQVNQKNLKCFNVNIHLFYESQFFNTYYNRKICIDQNGDIKNAPETEEVFGNVQKEKVEKIIELKAFQKLWRITKNDIDICKQCEFRYMCVDPSQPTKKENGSGYTVGVCNYNPIIAKWEEPKSRAI